MGTGPCVHAAASGDHIPLADFCWHRGSKQTETESKLNIITGFHIKRPRDASDQQQTQEQAKERHSMNGF